MHIMSFAGDIFPVQAHPFAQCRIVATGRTFQSLPCAAQQQRNLLMTIGACGHTGPRPNAEAGPGQMFVRIPGYFSARASA